MSKPHATSKNFTATGKARRAGRGFRRFAPLALIALLAAMSTLVLSPASAAKLVAAAQDAPATRVSIDIMPGVSPNNIDLSSDATISVAILSSAGFDAASVDVNDLTLAGAQTVKNEAGESSTAADVNEDGLTDMVVYYYVPRLKLTAASTDASLSGKTSDGTVIEGSDSVSCTGGSPQVASSGWGFGRTGAIVTNPAMMIGTFEAVYNYVASFFASPAPAPAAAALATPTPVTTTITSTGGSIVIPNTGSQGPANPYPSTISVSGLSGSIDKLTVSLNGVTNSSPPDLDILLVGPSGQKLLLMSDVGKEDGSTKDREINNVTFTFADAAALAMVNGTQYLGGTFKPSNANPANDNAGDAFNAPAPAGPYSSLLSVFNNTNPNGTWSLYVMDDKSSDNGTITSWSLNITYTPTATDTTAPTTSATPVTGTAGNNGWYRSNVTVTLSATDSAPSGVTPSGVNGVFYRVNGGSFSPYTLPFTVSTEGNNTVEYYATDAAGNTEATNNLSLKIDKTLPSVSFGAASPAANAAGWNNTNVSQPFTITDATSGVDSSASTASPLSLTAEGSAVTADVTATDQAGNSTTATSPSFKIDKTAPSISASRSPVANSFGWNNTDVVASYSAGDALSGLDASSPAAGSHTFDADGANQSKTFTVTDLAGNSNSASVTDVNIDTVAPSVTAVRVTAANAHGWNNSAVSVSYTANDALSGVDTGASDASPASVSTDGANQSKTFTVYDKAGNSGTGTVNNINIDTVAPTITADRTPAVNANGWNNSNVTASYTAADALSGLDASSPATGNFVFNTDGANQSHLFTVTDKAGNSNSATVGDVNIDTVAPSISAQRDTPANADGWNNSDVASSYAASDALSGLPAGTDAGNFTFNADGANQSHEFTVTDKAGNSASATVSGVNIDTVAPSISASRAPLANANGWNNTNVTASYTASDALAGLNASSPAAGAHDFTAEGEGQAKTFTVTDKAGNSASATVGDVNIDKTAPVVAFGAQSPTANANGWNNSNVSIPFTVTETLSGVDTASGASPLVLSAEGAAVNGSVTVTDKAGNSTTQTSPSVKIDKAGPAISASAAKADASAYTAGTWTNQSVTVSYNCTDGGSGVGSVSGPETKSVEGANQSATGTCTDLADNAANATFSDIDIDKTAPSVTAVRDTPANGNGWNNSNVSVSYTATDALSGVNAGGSDATPASVSGEGANQSKTFTVYDNAGNSATGTVSGINIDKTAPAVSASRAPVANANGWNNSNVTASASASDALSGIDNAASTLANVVFSAEAANQSTTFTAVDLAGNSATASVTDVNIDKTAPSVTAVRGTAANANGWNNSAVSVSYTANDALSGVDGSASDASPFSITSDGAGQSHTFTAYDKAGNSATGTVSGVNIDTVAPTISAGRTPAANSFGWNNTDVVASYNAADALSGLDASSPAAGSHTFDTEGANQSKTFTVTDLAGNSNSGSVTDVNIDLTKPTLSFAAQSPAANANGWNNSNVSFGYTAGDNLSGVDTTSQPSPVVLSAEGAAVNGSVTVTDKAGNSDTFNTGNVKIDKTAPALSATAKKENGDDYVADTWTNQTVTVTFACSDSLSGSSGDPAPQPFSSDSATHAASATCTDDAGNTSNTAGVSPIKVDKTKPTLTFGAASPAANGAGWNNTNVTFGFTTGDNLSGVASPTTTSVEVSEEGTGKTASVTVTDNAGNSETFTTNAVKIDKTKPVITAQRDTAPNGNGWNNVNVLSSFTASDVLSGLATPANGSHTFTAEGANQSHTFSATDVAGNTNTADVTGVSIDKTVPSVSASRAPVANANGWNNTNVTASASASDSLSGIDNAASTLTDVVFSAEGTNLSTNFTAVDKAGNSASAGVSGINLDKTVPTISLVAPTSGNYTPFSTMAASYTCAESGAVQSGVDTCAGTVPSGSNIDTTPLGTKTFTVNATDKAGNAATPASATYTLLYTFNGFFQPVDNLPLVNRAQAGSAIPVKFSLGGNQGLNIMMAGFPVSGMYPCSAAEPVIDIEQTVNAGGSSLNYDAVANQYVYVWKTDKSWAGQCRQLVVRLVDGTERRANFQFKK